MIIEKYKYLGNGKYKIIIDNNEFTIYEDIILKYSILGKDTITKKELDECLKDNDFYEAYYKSVNYIKKRLRSKKEIRKYLTKDYSDKTITNVIEKLTKEGYLDENIFTDAYIMDQINLKVSGPIKIENELIKLGISKDIIEKHLQIFTKDEQYQKIRKIIKKEINLNKNKSEVMLKNKLLKSLIDKGFFKEDILSCIEEYDFDDSKIYEVEYKKAYDKLSKKYSGKELEYKIKEKMYQKGFRV